MKQLNLFYATNRNHEGDRWKPTGYGTGFSSDGMENLRFGKVTLKADERELATHLQADGSFGTGQGIKLADYLTEAAAGAVIRAYPEKIPDRQVAEVHQPDAVLGSRAMFREIKSAMEDVSDVLIYIHGFSLLAGRGRLGPGAAGDAGE